MTRNLSQFHCKYTIEYLCFQQFCDTYDDGLSRKLRPADFCGRQKRGLHPRSRFGPDLIEKNTLSTVTVPSLAKAFNAIYLAFVLTTSFRVCRVGVRSVN